MRFQRLFWAVVFSIVASIGIRPVKADDAAERFFYNARIFTAEPEHPYAEGGAIRGERIVAVGSRADVEKKVGKQAERIDPHGQWLLPGFIDSHTQRMPCEATLYAYTINSARAMNEQELIGSITAGKQADPVLVDRDVLTAPVEERRAAKVVWTMVGGKIAYQAH